MMAYIGIDPTVDITWTGDSAANALRLFEEGQLDAYMAFAPEPQDLRARGARPAIVNTAVDRPWSHYYCCVVNANRAFVQNHPVATKHALRAILKATDICASQPGEPPRPSPTMASPTGTSRSGRCVSFPTTSGAKYDPEERHGPVFTACCCSRSGL